MQPLQRRRAQRERVRAAPFRRRRRERVLIRWRPAEVEVGLPFGGGALLLLGRAVLRGGFRSGRGLPVRRAGPGVARLRGQRRVDGVEALFTPETRRRRDRGSAASMASRRCSRGSKAGVQISRYRKRAIAASRRLECRSHPHAVAERRRQKKTQNKNRQPRRVEEVRVAGASQSAAH